MNSAYVYDNRIGMGRVAISSARKYIGAFISEPISGKKK
jgi:hypothetical protein